MGQVTRAASKLKFETGDTPSAADFVDLHDSAIWYDESDTGGKTPLTLTDGSTITWSIALGHNAKVTLGGNRTLAITNAVSGDYGTLVVTQDATGSRTLALPAGSKVISAGSGAVTLTTTAAAIDILSFFYNGTNYFWTIGKNYT